jgi:osmotically inducible protein OsmC
MAVESRADVTWEGDLLSGAGHVTPASGAFPQLPLTWSARSESREKGTSPEELLAAAHAACFSMALSFGLAQSGHAPERLDTTARVGFQAGEGVTGVHLSVRGRVPGLDDAGFREAAEAAKATCPLSKALAGVEITLAEAELL